MALEHRLLSTIDLRPTRGLGMTHVFLGER